MKIDFCIDIYKELINTIINAGYIICTFKDFELKINEKKIVILRHDVDKMPFNSLKTAKIEHELGIIGTYNFRIVPESYNEKIIKHIAELGHEIGYHYENMNTCHGDIDSAWDDFRRNLDKLRKLYPVKTICMHGSPWSKWDNRKLWDVYEYRSFGINAEPYFDIDFSKVLYLTDTGRRWDGERVSVRDKVSSEEYVVSSREKRVGSRKYVVNSKKEGVSSREYGVGSREYGVGSREKRVGSGEKGVSSKEYGVGWKKEEGGIEDKEEKRPLNEKFRFHSTFDIIKSIENGDFPDKVMITTHPQRWTNKPLPWVKELIWQNVKNLGKVLLVNSRK